MIEKIVDKITNKMDNLAEGIESVVWGEKDYNLEINLEKTFQGTDKEKSREIGRYTGSFIVTSYGYLRRGHDNKLDKKYAQIMGSDPDLPPFIFYENSNIPKPIIETILGLRLAEFAYKPEIQNNFSFAY